MQTRDAEKIILQTSDGVKIVGDYYRGEIEKGVLLLHMMPATRQSWDVLIPKLTERMYHVCAIDLRGHGESINADSRGLNADIRGQKLDYRNFSDFEHKKSIYDVDAAIHFLKEKEIPAHHIAIVGASIGANLALWYAADYPQIQKIILLSPGFNYRGIETKPLVQRLHAGQHVLFASSHDDYGKMGSNADMNRALYELTPPHVEKKLITYSHAGHGTDMFGKEPPDLAEEILRWIQ